MRVAGGKFAKGERSPRWQVPALTQPWRGRTLAAYDRVMQPNIGCTPASVKHTILPWRSARRNRVDSERPKIVDRPVGPIAAFFPPSYAARHTTATSVTADGPMGLYRPVRIRVCHVHEEGAVVKVARLSATDPEYTFSLTPLPLPPLAAQQAGQQKMDGQHHHDDGTGRREGYALPPWRSPRFTCSRHDVPSSLTCNDPMTNRDGGPGNDLFPLPAPLLLTKLSPIGSSASSGEGPHV
jgi:hypothetical protein